MSRLKIVFWFTLLLHVSFASATVEPRIVGGVESEKGDWAAMAALVRSNATNDYQGQYCGGALIAEDWVLTAAHCTYDISDDPIEAHELKVVIGRHNLLSSNGEERRLAAIHRYPEFEPQGLDDDIALLKLAHDVETPPAQLFSGAPSYGVEAHIVGWGSLDAAASDYPRTLHQAEVEVVSNERCNQPRSYGGEITETMVCAGTTDYTDPSEIRDTCAGDSGGPLFVEQSGEWRIAGVTAWGDGCAQPEKFGVYMRIAPYADWIRDLSGVSAPATPDTGDGGGGAIGPGLLLALLGVAAGAMRARARA